MSLIEVNAEEFSTICNSVLGSCFSVLGQESGENVAKVRQLMTSQILANAKKYEALGLHYIITTDWNDYPVVMESFITPYAKDEFIKLLSMTNNLSEFTSIPVKDDSKETNTQNVGTFSMTENQPVDATETITTPYIKVSGKNNYTNTKETQHNTVNEYKARQEIMNGNVQTIFNFLDSWMEKMIYEYCISY
jgi:hypothetical protein